MTNKGDRYLAYMLRLWQADDDKGEPVWRASLESPHTAERQGFADLEGLFAFLKERTGVGDGEWGDRDRDRDGDGDRDRG